MTTHDPLLATVADTDDAERSLADEAPEVELVDEQITAWQRAVAPLADELATLTALDEMTEEHFAWFLGLDLPPATEDLHTAARLHTIARHEDTRRCPECGKSFPCSPFETPNATCYACFLKWDAEQDAKWASLPDDAFDASEIVVPN